MLKKLASFTMGLIVTLVLVEGGLALAYKGFMHFQARRNRDALTAIEGEVRVLAIGESTTAVAGDSAGRYLTPTTAYPAQLERILNERQDQVRFRVMNNGIMGGTSESSLDLLELTLPELKPHVIIAMMGIKDSATAGPESPEAPPSWTSSLRTVQLLTWLREGESLRRDAIVTEITSLEDIPDSMRDMEGPTRNYVMETRVVGAPEAPGPQAMPAIKIGLYYWYIGRAERAERELRAVIAEHDVGYNVLAQVLASEGRRAEARALLEGAIAEHPEEGMYQAVLAGLLIEEERLEEADAVLSRALEGLEDFEQVPLVRNYLYLAQADLFRERGEYDRSLAILEEEVKPEWLGAYKEVFPAPELLKESGLGQAYLAKKDWKLAERHLRRALDWNPKRHVNMWLLSTVYRETGQVEKEEEVRRELLRTTGRVAEYFELAKLFRLSGDADRIPELMVDAVAQVPSLKENYGRLYELTEREGIQLVVMQYPSFSQEALHLYAPAAEDVVFIDNEHVFDADPDGYFFEPKFPHSFSHYTESGAEVLAEHVADTLLRVHGEE